VQLIEHLTQLKTARLKVLVVGDIMLDHYRIGEATRISPEAPVPVLLNPRDEFRLGGAAAVASMCAALGAEVVIIGMVGSDRNGERVLHLLDEANVVFSGMVVANCVTTTKERICGIASGRHRQQLGRIDCEQSSPLPLDTLQALRESIDGMAGDPPSVLLVADYAKGVVSPDIALACRKACSLAIADPPRGSDWSKFNQYGCIVPNREEAGRKSARQIRTALHTHAAIVKLDQQGCELDADEPHLPVNAISAKPLMVHDVTGVGDQFLAVLGCIRASGVSWLQAAELANVAAGLQVERHGCVPVTIQELIQEISGDSLGASAGYRTGSHPHSILAATG
jgi:rfaE bifunctional protein kinase chain/domain